jgi:hypothetical protein
MDQIVLTYNGSNDLFTEMVQLVSSRSGSGNINISSSDLLIGVNLSATIDDCSSTIAHCLRRSESIIHDLIHKIKIIKLESFGKPTKNSSAILDDGTYTTNYLPQTYPTQIRQETRTVTIDNLIPLFHFFSKRIHACKFYSDDQRFLK